MAIAEQREDAGIGAYLAGGGTAALFVALAEVLMSDGSGAPRLALVSAATFLLPLGLLVGVTLWSLFRLTALFPTVRRLLTAGPAPESPMAAAAPFLLVFLPLLLLFSIPSLFVVSGLLGKLVGSEIIRTLGTGGAAAAVAAAIGAAGLSATGLVALLARLGHIPRPTPLLFWTVAFPTPWCVVTYLVLLDIAEAMGTVALLLSGATLVAVTISALLVMGRSARIGAWGGITAAAMTTSLLMVSATGTSFDPEGLERSLLATAAYGVIQPLVDLDGDGHAYLFERLDCDESDAERHNLAFDLPGNGIDEDCDGSDAEEDDEATADMNGEPAEHLLGAGRFNVILIHADALRADHSGFLGYKRDTTPNIDKLAESSLVFAHAVSQSSATGYSLFSLLAGKYPNRLDWVKGKRRKDFALSGDDPLLPGLLREQGWDTAAVVSRWITLHLQGFADVFDTISLLYPKKGWKKHVRHTSVFATAKAIAYLETRPEDQPFFLYVHYPDPHHPYVNHEGAAKVFGKSAMDRYDSDVSFMDMWMGAFFQYLETTGLMEDTVIVLASDHGEEFGEHGKKHHGKQLYEESVHVPLLVYIPGVPPSRIETTVALVDVVPTMLDALSIPGHREELDGVSLFALLEAKKRHRMRPLFSVLGGKHAKPKRSLSATYLGDWKYILNNRTGSEELYDLRKDPEESENLVEDETKRLGELRRLAREFASDSSQGWEEFHWK